MKWCEEVAQLAVLCDAAWSAAQVVAIAVGLEQNSYGQLFTRFVTFIVPMPVAKSQPSF